MIKTEEFIRELVFIFFIQFKIIMGIALVISCAAVVIALYMPPIYSISSKVLIQSKTLEKTPESLDTNFQKIEELSKEDLFSEIEIINSPDVIKNTIKALKISRPELLAALLPLRRSGKNKTSAPESGAQADSKREIRLIRHILGNLETNLLHGSRIIEVAMKTKKPGTALPVLEQILDSYIEYRSQIQNPVQAQLFFETQVNAYYTDMITLENKLNDLAVRSNTADVMKEIENNLFIKKDLEQQKNIAKTGWIEKKRSCERLRSAVNAKGIQFFSFLDNMTITQFADKLQILVIERGNILRKYQPQSTRINSLDEQISSTYALLNSEAAAILQAQETRLMIYRDTIEAIDEKLTRINERNILLHRHSVEYKRVKRLLELKEDSYKTLKKRLEQTLINKASDKKKISAATIVSRPFYSGIPVFPNKKILIPVGILTGLITGLALGFLSEYFDRTVKRPEDINKFIDLPIIFSLPRH